MAREERDAVFALLDDCDSTTVHRSSRLYTGFVHERVCVDGARLDEVCESVAADSRNGLHAVVLGDYEFGRDLALEHGVREASGAPGQDAAGSPHEDSTQSAKTQRGNAALRFLLFRHCQKLSRDEADAWLAQQDGAADESSVAGVGGVHASVDFEQFEQAIAAVHEALRAGDSYQVNYTYRLGFDVFGTPLALYRRLRASQPVRYGALIALPDDRWVLSCSPELFVEKNGRRLGARPMKGTAPRSPDP
ncbi:MAG: chorismate-binding protein, partial [Paraburkholderia sp.]|nr:chorismate-binding protein [Paraburkholderia sp.]